MRCLVDIVEFFLEGSHQLAGHFGFVVRKGDDVGFEPKCLLGEGPDGYPSARQPQCTRLGKKDEAPFFCDKREGIFRDRDVLNPGG